MLYYSYCCLHALTALLPLRFQYWLARRLAGAAHLLDGRGRAAVRANLRAILGPDAPEREVRRRARETFRSFAAYLCEFFGVDRLGAEYIREHVAVQGRENLDRALAGGRGLLFVSAHYSNWELGAFVVGRLGYPILIIAQIHPDERVNELFVGQRAKHGVSVAATAHGARAALRALRENRPVAILGDRPTGGPTVRVELCGRPAEFPVGPWRLALDSGAPLLPTFMRRVGPRDYRLEIGAPLEWPATGEREARLGALAQAFAQELEARLRADPSQWAAFYPAWEASGASAAAGRAREAREPAPAAGAEAAA